ncbi:MAG: hypothetical protein RIR51_1844 [Bacteroidota bacterium]
MKKISLKLNLLLLFVTIPICCFSQQKFKIIVENNTTFQNGGNAKLIIGRGSSDTTIFESKGSTYLDKGGNTIIMSRTIFKGTGDSLLNSPYEGNSPIANFYNLIQESSDTTFIEENTNGVIFVRNLLKPSQGYIQSNGKLIFKSTEYTTNAFFNTGLPAPNNLRTVTNGNPARITNANCGSILGDVIVERPISNTLIGNRLLSPGVIPTGTIQDNWQETNSGTAYHNYGTFTYGPGGSTNGFDGSTGSNTYSTIAYISNGAYSYLSSTNNANTQFALGKGLSVVVYGDRRNNYSTTSVVGHEENGFNYTILRTKGALNQCDFTFPTADLPTDGTEAAPSYIIIGNPFWANYDMSSLTKTNISDTYYYLNPSVYREVSDGATTVRKRGNYIAVNTTNLGPSEVAKIDPGQAVIIGTIGNTPSLSFPKSGIIDSNTVTEGLVAFSKTTSSNTEHLIIEGIYKENNMENFSEPFSTVRVSFSSKFSNNFGPEESISYLNLFENLSISNFNKDLAIEGRNLNSKADTINLQLRKLFNSPNNSSLEYGLGINTKYLSGDKLYVLFDKSSFTYTQIPAYSNEIYKLNIENGKHEEDKYAILILDKSYQSLIDFSNSKEKLNMAVYPNPSSDYITVLDQKLAGSRIDILGTNGNNILSKTLEKSENLNKTGIQLDVKNYSSGAYLVRLINEDGQIKTQKFVKE